MSKTLRPCWNENDHHLTILEAVKMTRAITGPAAAAVRITSLMQQSGVVCSYMPCEIDRTESHRR